MKIYLYGYDNTAYAIDLPDKEIQKIEVVVISGDEAAIFHFTDGSVIRGSQRVFGFFDGAYVVKGDRIKEWLGFDFRTSKERA